MTRNIAAHCAIFVRKLREIDRTAGLLIFSWLLDLVQCS